jgi:hypothetical protein
MATTIKWLIQHQVKITPGEKYIPATGDRQYPTSDPMQALAFATRDEAQSWMRINAVNEKENVWREREHAFWDGQGPEPHQPYSRVK